MLTITTCTASAPPGQQVTAWGGPPTENADSVTHHVACFHDPEDREVLVLLKKCTSVFCADAGWRVEWDTIGLHEVRESRPLQSFNPGQCACSDVQVKISLA